jgi:hypothetical protein
MHMTRERLRSGGLLFAGVVLGIVVVGPAAASMRQPIASATTAELATTQSRSVSCSSTGFFPLDTDTGYENYGAVRSAERGDTLRCEIALPHRATVTRVRFTLWDNNSTGSVGPCELRRMDLVAATTGVEQTMASLPATGLAAVPGNSRVSTSSISFASVDDSRYAYWLQCNVSGTPFIGIYGADVTFSISSANG